MLLGCASQRLDLLALEWSGNDYLKNIAAERKRKERGVGPGFAECGVVIFVISRYPLNYVKQNVDD